MNLVERVGKSGSRFYLQKTINGSQKQIAVGKTKALAKTRAHRFLATLEEYGYEAALSELKGGKPIKRGDSPTYDDMKGLYESYLAQAKPLREKTVYDNLIALRRIMSALKASTIAQIDPQKLRKALLPEQPTDSQQRGFASTIRCAKSIFKVQALDFYVTRGIKLENPFAKVELAAPKIEAYTPVSTDLYKAVRACASHLEPCEALIILLALKCGLRRKEIEHARVGWFTVSDKVYLSVKAGPGFVPKSGEKRVFPIDRALYDELLALRAAANPTDDFFVPVFSKAGQGRLWRRFQTVNAWLRNLDPDLHIHNLRKEAGSEVAQKNGIFESQKVLGHSTPVITAAYYANLTNIGTVGGEESIPTPEEVFAKSVGMSVEQLRSKLAG